MEALAHLRAEAVVAAINPDKPTALREQFCGRINTIDYILEIEKQVKAFHALIAEARADLENRKVEELKHVAEQRS